MKKHSSRLIFIIVSALIMVLFSLLISKNMISFIDNTLQDQLCQNEQVSSGNVVIIGIDDRAIDELGPFSKWGRDVMAKLIECLNVSEDNRPAAICLDIIFSGEQDEEEDRTLAEAAAKYGNVIVGSSVEFGTTLNADKTINTQGILNTVEPYDALADAANVANINAMLDSDGIFRHHLLQITMPDGTVRKSMALLAADMFLEFWNDEACKKPDTTGLGFWYLPFTGLPGTFYEGISIVDILNGTIPPEYFYGKIVMIGPYSVGLQDQYPTSIDHAEYMYGLEIQANAVEALLYPQYKTEIPLSIQLVVLWILGILLIALLLRKKLWPAILVWLAECGGWYVSHQLLLNKGYLITVLWIPLCLTILLVTGIVLHAVANAMEKRRITDVFKHYVAPEIVNELIKQGQETLALGGHVANIAVLFVDIRGFTTMSENLPPTEVVSILNEYLSLVTDCVIQNRGTLDKFIGDAAMAIWGAPLKEDDPVMPAVRAAMDMVHKSETLSENLMKKYGRTVSFGIGIHYGEAVVGNMGSSIHMDYTAIGDTVNTAARLEANAPAGHIYISRAVAEALNGRVSYTSLGNSIYLKGKKEGFEVLDLNISE